MDLKKLVTRIVRKAKDKQAQKIVVLDMRKACNFCDYFVIATANSSVHLKAVAEAITEDLEKERIKPLFPFEEQIASGWVVLDYSGVIVHLFLQPLREFYDLEHLWQASRKIRVPLRDTSG